MIPTIGSQHCWALLDATLGAFSRAFKYPDVKEGCISNDEIDGIEIVHLEFALWMPVDCSVVFMYSSNDQATHQEDFKFPF